MLRRSVFGVSLVLVTAGVIGASVAWFSDGDLAGWVLPVTLLGALFLAAGVSISLREMMRGLWKIAAMQSKSRARTDAVQLVVNAIRKEEASRQTEIIRELVLLDKKVADLEKSQAERVLDLSERLSKDYDSLVEAIERNRREPKDTLNAIGKIQQDEKRRSSERWRRSGDLSMTSLDTDARRSAPLCVTWRRN